MEGIKICLFADDTAILTQHHRPISVKIKLQKYLLKYEKWLEKWKIQVNTDKSHAILFKMKRNPIIPELKLHNKTIAWTQEVQYLGVTLDRKLNYNTHCDNIIKNYWKKYFSIHHLLWKRSALSIDNKLLIYKMILRPLLLYACSIWGCTTKRNIQQIQYVQNKTLRKIVGAPKYFAIETLHKELNTTTITEEIVNQAKKFYEKIATHSNPTIRGQGKYFRRSGRYPYPHQSKDRKELIHIAVT
ncbi:RNA-directed DNA polymerase from mobile element jockey [Nephila pilipes]|uniref:RNA-directed DNA polymerase from mobile element jockey n=1 Tax=Nephila pilipes TaxID=299642 RepID=A0A8X6UVT8_NEPPI|nr:RNA-directed DNA polymerase from mobile element jockey [Nephila pilipes]